MSRIYKIIVYALFFQITTSVFAQQKAISLDWGSIKKIEVSNKKDIAVYGFQTENFNYNFAEKTVKFVEKVDFYINNDTKVAKVSYQNCTPSELRGYDVSKLKNTIDFNIKNVVARGVVSSVISFNPIVKIDGQVKRVTTLSIVLDTKRKPSPVIETVPNLTNSALSEGQWYKFYINKTGAYKLDKTFFSNLGIDTDAVNPQNIRLFGNGGKAIPLENNQVTQFDVTENAVRFHGENDASFDTADYMLFYAVSAYGWHEENDTHINPYHNNTYYYINVSSEQGKRMQSIVEPTTSTDHQITTFTEYQYHEVDETNLVSLGRRWFGEEFNIENNQSFNFSFPRINTSSPVKISLKTAATSSVNSSMNVSVNNTSLVNMLYPAIGSISLATAGNYSGETSVSSTEISVELNYNNNGVPSANAYLDYISVESTSFLKSLGKQFSFKSNEVLGLSGIKEYQVSDAENVSEIWNITDPYNVASKLHAGANVATVKTAEQTNEYLAVVPTDYYTPILPENTTVASVNLKNDIFFDGLGNFEEVDYIVVTPLFLKSQADRLAEINSVQLGLRTRVVTLEDIYSEFNTGNQDIGAIRNFVRYVYHNGTDGNKLKYLCLFGDASYDVKNRLSINTNIVPTYHRLSSFSLLSSFMSDDYYGFMDANEGNFEYDLLDVAVGRILASNLQQATTMVDKVSQYYMQESYGSWRNKMTIISDDVDNDNDNNGDDWEFDLEKDLDELADEIVEETPFVNVVKIHSDAFVQESTAGGDLYPEVTEAIINNIQLGSLVVNYFGHGSEDGLAHERLFQKNDAQSLINPHKYNLFITITCEFARFDNPLRQTAGEFTYWNPNGGAVSLVSTTREISKDLGLAVNQKLSKYLYDYNNTGYVSIAEALRLAKNEIGSVQKRVVFYIGDPALKLAIPAPNVQLTKINGISVTDPSVPALQGLSTITLSGEVHDASGALRTDYNGELSTVIYDKNQERSTLGNDYSAVSYPNLILHYTDLGEIIFRGQASVTNGLFEFNFVVPKDISIPLGEGRISFYVKQNGVLEDQTGVNTSVLIGGLNADAPEDNQPPKIEAFMNDESFISGGITNASPFLLLNLSDDNGINTASGIGHDITAILDGDETNPAILNDYYETLLDDYTQGTVKYQYKDLSPGLHTLKIKAWDVYNNSSTVEIQFVVVDENEELVLNHVLNYPNPFVSHTEFWFTHNSSSELDVLIQIYTVSGKLIKTLQGSSVSDNINGTTTLFRGLPWNGKDDFGNKIGKGVYVYKLTARSKATGNKAVKFEKLVIL